ncbi:type II secretion system protein GspC [Cloacibacillus sp.]|uniref:type II secretion system protein GspC n=1 Tax=Cloacibacillus sp. TaxID=2049023 RepID=UPI0025B80273|nr:type II secretion system protein GspC [Cloacibacillus sp.]MCC8057725.1 PDZ domain-containing protein [Cloacibacillus sp.]
MNFIASIKNKITDRLKYDGSYEQIVKFYGGLRSSFTGGEKAVKRDGSRMLTPALFVCGLFAGLCLCWMVKGALLSLRLDADIAAASRVSGRAPSFANAKSGGGLGDFTAANPFKADLPVKEDKAATRTVALDSLSLQGTLPNIGAWISDPEGTRLFLKGQTINGYTLEKIKYGEVVLADGKGEHTLYLFLSGGTAPRAQTPSPASPKAPPAASPKLDFSGVEPAAEGKEGAVPRELVDALLMNPYDELGKLRMVPAEDGSGMQLERIAPDSVFARVGVAQGDVIQAVNGVTISNMADAANAVNSLMAGTRFDVTVQRKGKPLELKYQVK